MKKRILSALLICLALVVLLGTVTVSAIVPYTSYTYNVFGFMAQSPHAYVPLTIVDSTTISFSVTDEGDASDNAKLLYGDGATFTGLDSPKDVFVDDLNNLYIANTGKNQVVVLDEGYNLRLVISTFTNQFGVPDALSSPSGIFVTDNEIFVADTDNSRIVVFDKLGNFVHIVPQPESEVLPEGTVYRPVAVSVDHAGRIYVVASSVNYGVISLNRDGSFNGFIGPQKVTYNAWEYFMRMFKTAEQLEASEKQVSTEFNNLTIDAEGFLYVTTNSIDEGQMGAAIKGNDKSGDYAPVKKLNPSGTDVMKREGFWPPSGEVDFQNFASAEFTVSGPSSIVDVALGPNNTWSIIDQKRSRVFTYDSNGNLLHVFGDTGSQIGNITNLVAIDYQGTNMLLLDRSNNNITVYKRTEYGDLLAQAIQNSEDKNYDKAVEYYIAILQRNNNYDTAYVGIADSLYRDGEYVQAMKYYKYAYNTEDYSEAYQAYRKIWMEENIWLIPLVLIVLLVAITKFFKYANKVNRRMRKLDEKTTFWQEILYGFHVIFHPFDGFWDLKFEKRGSFRGACFWLLVTALTYVYKAAGVGYLSNPTDATPNYFIHAISMVLPVILWVVANWCLTTLFDGEGSMKDVFITTCYALVPLPMIHIPCVMLSNVMTASELEMLDMAASFAMIWFVMLVFFGMMVIHDYSIIKNFITALFSLVGIALIMFIASLFSFLLTKLYTFFFNIYVEIEPRITS